MISVFAKQLGLTTRAIRYYEERGLIRPGRDRLNMRRFDPGNRERLILIAKLRRAGVSLAAIAEVLEDDAADRQVRVRLALSKVEARRVELAGELEAVEDVHRELLEEAERDGPQIPRSGGSADHRHAASV